MFSIGLVLVGSFANIIAHISFIPIIQIRKLKVKEIKLHAVGYTMSQSAQATITKYHRLSGLNNRHLFLTVLEARKSSIKALADLVLGKGFFPGL